MLGLVQAAMGEMGLTVPSYVASNTDTNVVQVLALLNQSGNELQREHDWQTLTVEYRFTVQYLNTTGTVALNSAIVTAIPTTAQLSTAYCVTGIGINQDTYVQSVDSATQVTLTQASIVTGTAQSLSFGKTKYTLPSDYGRQIDRTHWDKSKHWMMLGPETAQQWQWLKSGYIATGPRIRYRLLGGFFQIWPLTSSPEYLGFEYISTNWATSAASAGQTSFQADTDTCVYDDRVIINFLKWKYFSVKGFDSTQFQKDYMRELLIAKGAEAGSPTLSFCPQQSNVLIDFSNLPDSGFGV